MKKISIYLLSSLLLLSSCLDEDPQYTTDETVVYSSESSAQMALNGIYALMAIQGSFAQLLPEISTEATGNCWTTYLYSDIRAQYVDGAVSIDNEFNDRAWGALYQTISNCNIFIEACESDRSSDFDAKPNMVAQAKFMRGVCYYYLYNYWGGVPLRVTPTNSGNINMPRASRQEILDQIIKDWTDAAEDLDDESALGSNPTAPCKSSAWAYLAKLYWLMGCNAWAAEQGDPWATGQLKTEWPEMQSSNSYYLKAKEYGDKVFQANVFDLEPDFGTLFGGNRLAFSDEFVFVIDATMNTTENVGYNSLHWTFSPQQCSPGESWGRAQPNKAYYNWARGTYQDDPRLSYTFVSKWIRYADGAPSDEIQVAYPYVRKQINDTVWVDSMIRPGVTQKIPVVTTTTRIVDSIYYAIPTTNAPGDYSNEFFADVRNPKPSELDSLLRVTYCQTKSPDSWNINDWPYWGKYMTLNCSGRYADNNLCVYRYADFLLLMADVENELGNTGTAMGYVNRVLQRARQSTNKETGTTSHTYPKDIAGLNQADLREYIFNERLFELATEFDGFMDTRRRGINWRREVLEMNNNDSITSACYHYGLEVGYTARWREYWYPLSIENATDAQWEEFLIKNMLFPIPRVEFTTNEAISTTTDQNPGY